MTYHYSAFEAKPGRWGIVRTREDRTETLYAQTAGGLTFVKWENWPSADFTLAVYEFEEASGFAIGMNDKNRTRRQNNE